LGAGLRHDELGGDRVGLVLDVDHRTLRQPPHAAEQQLGVALDQGRPPGQVRVEALADPVVKRQHVVLGRLDQPEALELMQLVGMLGRQVPGLAPVAGGVVQLPAVVVERGCLLPDQDPRGLVPGDRGPALVVDAAVAEHLEVLGLVPVRLLGAVEGVGHAHPVQRHLLHAVDHGRLGQPGDFQDGGGQVDDVVELESQLAAGPEAAWPVHDHPVAGAAPVGSHLLGPLQRRVHGVRPADRVVVVGVRAAEVVSRAAMNSGVSRAAAPLKLIISLKVPFRVPSAEAPLSPMRTAGGVLGGRRRPAPIPASTMVVAGRDRVERLLAVPSPASAGSDPWEEA
jgi:hypothetical protein